jgi:hypothetical protein
MENDLTTYHGIRSDLKTGDLLEWRSSGGIGDLIRICDKQEVNHDSLVITSSEYPSTDRVYSAEALSYGFYTHRLSYNLLKYEGEVYLYQLANVDDSRRLQIGTWIMNHIGIGYDYSSLFANLLIHVKADDLSLFCSEACFLAFDYAGLVNGDKAPRPGELPKWFPDLFLPKVRIL